MGFTHLDSGSDDLVGISYGQRENFADPRSHYIRGVCLSGKRAVRQKDDAHRGRAKDTVTHQLIIFHRVGLPNLFKRSPFLFKRQPFDPFVRHELKGAVADAHQSQESPSIKTSHPFCLVYP